MRQKLLAKLSKDVVLVDLLRGLRDVKQSGGQPTQVTCDYRTEPYLDHRVVDWVDGPPSSNVVAVISGSDPSAPRWRRFTLSRRGPGHYELDAFPTPFKDPVDPLSPGIPPGAR